MSEEALAELAGRALAMAREAPEDEFSGLAPEEMLLRKKPGGLELADRNDPEQQELKDRALIAEEAARDVMGVSNSDGAGASAGRTHIALATSHGFSGSYAATSHGCYASVLAGERSEEHTSELQSLMRISYAVFCLKKKKQKTLIHA